MNATHKRIQNFLGTLLALSLMISTACSTIQQREITGTPALMVIVASKANRLSHTQGILSYAINKNGVWSAPSKLPDASEIKWSQSTKPEITRYSVAEAFRRSQLVGNRDLLLSISDGYEVSVPVKVGENTRIGIRLNSQMDSVMAVLERE